MVSTSAAQANDFSGFRVEVQSGLDAASAKADYFSQDSIDGIDGIDTNDDYSSSERKNLTGIFYGIGAGYDAEISPNIIAGIEGSINFSNSKFQGQYVQNGTTVHYHDEDDNIYDEYDYTNIGKMKSKRDIGIDARLGYKVNTSTLIYVKGGYVNGRFNLSGSKFLANENNNYSSSPSPYSYSKNLDGYRVGAGLETLLGNNVFTKLEYRYTNFKNFSSKYIHTDLEHYTGEFASTQTNTIGLSRHQLAAGLGIRF